MPRCGGLRTRTPFACPTIVARLSRWPRSRNTSAKGWSGPQINSSLLLKGKIMKHRWIWIICAALSIFHVAQTGRGPEAQTGQSSDAQNKRGPYARIAFLRPHDGRTVDFEAGYIRHLQWHKQAGDTWVWYGWKIWAGERQRWFVYATFGRSAASLDNPVSPAEDERDNILNVIPHCEFTGNGLYEYLPALSHGTGEPQPTARLEFTTVDLAPGAAKAFEAALSASQSTLQ